jgi:hypothetical protein
MTTAIKALTRLLPILIAFGLAIKAIMRNVDVSITTNSKQATIIYRQATASQTAAANTLLWN